MATPQLWMLVGGNGSGKTTFYQQFLKPMGMPFVNADLIAKEYFPDNPEVMSREAASMAERLRYRLLEEKKTFCFETVFSHVSKIDFIADAKAAGYEIVLVFIHLDNPELNKARVHQRVAEGGHDVPEDRITARVERLTHHVSKVIALGLTDEVHILDNSLAGNPFVRVATIIDHEVSILVGAAPLWLEAILSGQA
ncbi:MAG: zeta toxin family protein [Pseudomonadales bacterium]|nr:zeta toxin family protein [Pseudomonadales bacterium]